MLHDHPARGSLVRRSRHALHCRHIRSTRTVHTRPSWDFTTGLAARRRTSNIDHPGTLCGNTSSGCRLISLALFDFVLCPTGLSWTGPPSTTNRRRYFGSRATLRNCDATSHHQLRKNLQYLLFSPPFPTISLFFQYLVFSLRTPPVPPLIVWDLSILHIPFRHYSS